MSEDHSQADDITEYWPADRKEVRSQNSLGC